ncbi:hypothetical protein WMF04_28675 [Sorangium sp. So ce260]|uniref:hypothetical protein n=1 Tax=Sorangium sp. So ce260 TaxID=3133291 RepID=UPI003F5F53A6
MRIGASTERGVLAAGYDGRDSRERKVAYHIRGFRYLFFFGTVSIAEARRSRLGLCQTAMRTKKVAKLRRSKFRRRPGRGHHTHLRAGPAVTIDPDIWPHLGSAEAVNEALRALVGATKHMRRTGS